MNFFSDQLGRLKYALRVSKDGEVGEALGLSKTAFAERKRRKSFPERELYDLAAKRPDLNLDVDYVLTGITREAHGRLDVLQGATHRAAQTGASYDVVRSAGLASKPDPAKTALIAAWQNCSPEDRKLLNKLAASLAEKGKAA